MERSDAETDDPNDPTANDTSSDDDLPTELPRDSVMYKGDGEDEETRNADGGASITRRVAIGGLTLGAGALGGVALLANPFGGDDAEEDDPATSASATDAPEDEASESDATDPAVTFDNQAFGDGTVSVEATTTAASTVLVTYGDDGDRIVAGTAAANYLDGYGVTVDLERTAGVPGAHTAHVVQNEDLDSNYGPGDELTADTIDSVVAADTAFVSGDGGDVETDVTFDDQPLDLGKVSLDLTTPADHFLLLTYERDGDRIVAGADDASRLDEETRTFDIVDRSGVPGEHAARVVANEDGSRMYLPGDALSDETAAAVTAADAATVAEAEAETETAAAFADQPLDDGSVDLQLTAPDDHFVLVTYRAGGNRVVAGADDASGLDGESITVDIGDDRGVSGLHTAYVIANEDGSQLYEPGDTLSEGTAAGVKVAATARVTEE